MTSADVEALALEAHALANLPLWFPTAAELAQALGIAVVPVAGGRSEALVDLDAIAVGPDSARAFAALALVLVHRRGLDATGELVDHLALALAIPADRADRAQYFAQHLPADDVARRVAQLGAAR